MSDEAKVQERLQMWQQDGHLIDVSQFLSRAANLWPETTAYICGNDSITYQVLAQASNALAEHLISQGVKAEDRVLIYYENSIDFFIAYFAIWHIGAIVAPLSIFLKEEEILRIISDAKPTALVISDNLYNNISPEKLTPALIRTEAINKAKNAHTDTTKPHKRDIHAIAALLYTSGTTGFPKAVMLSSSNILHNIAQLLSSIDINFQTRTFCPLPLFHCLPQNVCVWATCLVGGTAITTPKIDRRSLLKAIDEKPNVIVAVPALYGLFCLMKNLDFSSVNYFACGADILPDKIRTGFELIYRRKIINGYGMTECSPFISAELDDALVPTSSVGRPFPGIQIAIRDDKNEEMPEGSIGTIWIKGSNVMMGYYQAPEATEAILKNGWLNTGDLGRLVDDKLELCGRVKDLIINKGIKIYPQEIEQHLLRHPQVAHAAVIGRQIDGEEIPIAFVAAAGNASSSLEQELLQWCKEHLSFYKIPRKIIILKELPMNQTGKVDKKKLIQLIM